jgi:predicted RNA-binding protein YlqC (UPF0109 family)
MSSPVDFVLAVAKQLVDRPDEVRARWVDAADDDRRRGDSDDDGFVELTVNPSERGKIIGRRGRTIDSLRTVATAAFGQGGTIGVEVAE